MTSYREFQAELQKLHEQAERARRAEKSAALEKIRALIVEYELLPSDLGLEPPSRRTGRAPVPPKYRNPETGATWSGRGRVPKWLEGKDRTQFGIE